jgi:hypothetical protein
MARSLNQTLLDLRDQLDAAGYPNMPIGITEANICHKNDIDDPLQLIYSTNANLNTTPGADDLLTGNGANSFIAGQFWAEMLYVSMKHNVKMLNFWSAIEGSNDPGDLSENTKRTNAGFIDYRSSMSYKKKSTYYHYQMVAQNFRDSLLQTTDNRANCKAFAGISVENGISVMLMNQESSTNLSYTVYLDNSGGSGTFYINVNAGKTGKTSTGTIEAQSTVLLLFDLAGNLKRKCVYEMNGHADNGTTGIAPTCTDYCIGNTDAYVKDYNDDDGYEPSSIYPYYLTFSNDIWVRNDSAAPTSTDPPAFANEFQHQNPEWTNDPAQVPWAYVKVRNRGCDSVTGTVHLYYTRGNLGDKWDNYNSTTGKWGNWTEIGAGEPVSLGTLENGTYAFKWDSIAVQPDPDTLANFNFCLLSRFIASGDAMYSEYADTSGGWNAQLNNNIAQKNIIAVDEEDNNRYCIYVRNINPQNAVATLTFVSDDSEAGDLLSCGGHVFAELGDSLYNAWTTGGQQGNEIRVITGTHQVEILSTNAYLANIALGANAVDQICFSFTYEPGLAGVFHNFDAREFLDANFTGAERFIVTYPDCPVLDLGANQTIGRKCPYTITPSPSLIDANYIWVVKLCDAFPSRVGDTVGTGNSFSAYMDATITYEVFMSLPNGCYSSDVVSIIINELDPCRAMSIESYEDKAKNQETVLLDCAPNPASNFTRFNYQLAKSTEAEITISNSLGRVVQRLKLSNGQNYIEADLTMLNNGIYFYSLLVDNKNINTKKLIISK